MTCAGIQVPLLIPGLTALLAGLLLAGGIGLLAAVTAFVSGVTGVLLGGNIANLYRIKDLEVPEISVGGAGTFRIHIHLLHATGIDCIIVCVSQNGRYPSD